MPESYLGGGGGELFEADVEDGIRRLRTRGHGHDHLARRGPGMKVASAGAELAVYDVGEGPAVLWIQGTGVAAVGWDPQIEALRTSFRCVSFDNRGKPPRDRG